MVEVDLRHSTDLFVRTSYIDAKLALHKIEKGKAEGRRTALWFRSKLQDQFFQLGKTLYHHPGKVLFLCILVLGSFCVGLKSVWVNSRVEKLWIAEGGRLESELKYTEKALKENGAASTHQLVIQIPQDPGANLLTPAALLHHMDVLKIAASTTVELYDVTWRLKDLCYAPSFPNFDYHYIDQIFESIIPCSIITPLDCFWEGSKLLGPNYPVVIPGLRNGILNWMYLNPREMVKNMKELDQSSSFPFDTLEKIMKRAGITTGYQEKPCLNPKDPHCPDTAPNKKSGKIPDIGAELTGGCYGFAAKYMHWPEELLVGGAKKNYSGSIQRAHALQSVVQLISERELYESLVDTYRVHHVDWNPEKAAAVLDLWQKKFSESVSKQIQRNSTSYTMLTFSTATLNDIVGRFSEISYYKVGTGILIMLVFATVSFFRYNDPVGSRSSISIAGIILLCFNTAATLGFCSLLGIFFNATVTEIVPFLALGLGIIDMFLITNTYSNQPESESRRGDEQVGYLLKKIGLSVLLKNGCLFCAFLSATLIPIPALKNFSFTNAMICLSNVACMLLVFPSIISIDIRRKRSGRADILCCFLPPQNDENHWPCMQPSKSKKPKKISEKLQAITRALPPDRLHTVTVLAPSTNKSSENPTATQGKDSENTTTSDSEQVPVVSENGTLVDENENFDSESINSDYTCNFKWDWNNVSGSYAELLSKRGIKVFCIMSMIVTIILSVFGVMKVSDGLDLTDIVPQGTNEYKFLSTQTHYFGFYSMYAVTKGDFDYPNNQKLLYEYHENFMRVSNLIKNDDGGLPEFWLGHFRNWLIGLQKAFNNDWDNGCITQERWYSNASDEGILAYKLLVQTGHVDNPVDKSQVNQLRLVDSEGIINPTAFYNYLSAWVSNDALAYGASQANLRPEPKQWYHVASDYDLKIPKSSPLTYTQLPFYLSRLTDTNKITEMISQVRELCAKFEDKGLPNFPSGIPFLYWEQYMILRRSLGIAVLCALSAVFLVVMLLLFNIVAATVVTLFLGFMVIQLLAVYGYLGIHLSAIPAVLLIFCIGIGVHFTVHICLSFLTTIGTKNRRMKMAVKHMFVPVNYGAISLLVAVLMLGSSKFDFIVRCFFHIIIYIVLIGLLNGLFYFPIILSLFGPAPEVISLEYPDRISTPSPKPKRKNRAPSYRTVPPPYRLVPPPRVSNLIQHPKAPSLTTISEEFSSWHSQEICVEPEFVVETTTYTHTPPDKNSSDNESVKSSRSNRSYQKTIPQPHVTTKVKASTKFKVEVHTPILTSSVDSTYSKSSRRTDSSSSRGGRSDSSSGVSDSENSDRNS